MPPGKLTALAMAVLELLHERPMHPYEMTQLMRQRHVDIRAKVKAGSLYHTVERLAGQELIEVVDTQREGRRPERTVYGITEAGRDAFTERGKSILGTVAEEYPEFLTGLAVVDDLDREDVLHELRGRALHLQAAVASGEVITKELRASQLPEVYWLDWRFVMAQRQFELDWVRRVIDDIDAGRLTWTGKKHRRAPALSLIESEEDTDDQAS